MAYQPRNDRKGLAMMWLKHQINKQKKAPTEVRAFLFLQNIKSNDLCF
jgi:hypothetical protein